MRQLIDQLGLSFDSACVALKTRDHLMIDIETLSLKPTAFITSIGVTRLTTNSVLESQEYRVDLDDDTVEGQYDISLDTIKWRVDQSDAHRRNLISGTEPLSAVLLHLVDVVKRFDTPMVWFNHGYDDTVLRHAYRNYNYPVPWGHQQVMDFSIVTALFPFVKNAVIEADPPEVLSHTAEADTVWQANRLLAFFQLLDKGRQLEADHIE